MGIVIAAVGALTAYLTGSIPTSFIMARALKGIDIRQVGSGNVGATNVLRAVGRIPALIVLVADIGKGVLAATLIANYFYQFTVGLDYDFYRVLLGFAAICGHIWSPILKFKGGKGVATTIGVSIIIAPIAFLLAGGAWLMVFSMTNYVSLASIALGVAFPICAAALNLPLPVIIFSVAVCVISIYKHKGNIKRLLRGEEPKTHIVKRIKI